MVNQISNLIKQTLNICKLKNDIKNLVYFLHRPNRHIQDKTLYNGRMLEGTLLLVCSLH